MNLVSNWWWHKKGTQAKLFSAIGYFIIPHDLYPEDVHDPIGYVDYLILLLVVFLEIRDKEDMHKLLDNWNKNKKLPESLLNNEFDSMVEKHTNMHK